MKLKSVYSFFIEMFFPKVCLGCRRILEATPHETYLCPACKESIPMHTIFFRSDVSFMLAAATTYQNETVKKLIHTFKYEKVSTARYPLGELVNAYLDRVAIIPSENAVIVPVPLHPSRMKERGFNQAELLAKEISGHFGIPVCTTLLSRRRKTLAQAKRSIRDRKENVRGCFAVSQDIPFSLASTIILVDDVYTSGATLREIAKTLRARRVKNIIAVVVAKA